MAWNKERKRSGNPKAKEAPRVTFIQGLKLWANQWRPSNIKQIWNTEYRIKYNQTVSNVLSASQKLGR